VLTWGAPIVGEGRGKAAESQDGPGGSQAPGTIDEHLSEDGLLS